MQTVTVTGGNLFQIAAEYLQDATQWIRIAELNAISDPWLSGLIAINLPNLDRSAGGGVGQQ